MAYPARPIADRFWEKVNRTDGCWEWTAAKKHGYGQFTLRRGVFRGAHRIAYELTYGPIPPGMHIDHLCRNRCCVRPDHLEVVTQAENNRRSVRDRPTPHWQTLKTHCKHGHEFTPENTRISARGHRNCRTCDRIRMRETMRLRRQAHRSTPS